MQDIILKSVQAAQKEFEHKFPDKIVTRDFFRKFIKSSKPGFLESDYLGEYGSFANLIVAADILPIVNEEEIDTGVNREDLNIIKKAKTTGGPKRYFVSSIIAGAPIEEDFLSAALNYCKVTKSELVLLAMRGVTTADTFSNEILDLYEQYIATEYQFNKNLIATDFLLNPSQIIPLTGLPRFGQKEYSIIIAHSKQMLVSVPTKKGGIAHLVMSTGTINTPLYSSSRQGRLASQDNLLGGLIVEIADSKTFYVRQIQWINKCFCDLNKKYTKDSCTPEVPEAYILGDLHIGEQDDVAMKAAKEVIKYTGVKNIFIHDLVSMRSISHHEEHDLYAKHTRPEHQKTLEKELDYTGNWLKSWMKDIRVPGRNFIVVKSNHDEHLERYLTEGRFVCDHMNARLAASLFITYLDGHNPLEKYLKENFVELFSLKFLVRDQSIEISGIECGSHGDIGNNGGRGSMQSFELNFGRSVTAHSHSPAIFRDTWRVGTNSKLDLPYAKGGSSWLHTDCLVFKNGSRQLIVKIKGKWKI